jgi:hypothetical protein
MMSKIKLLEFNCDRIDYLPKIVDFPLRPLPNSDEVKYELTETKINLLKTYLNFYTAYMQKQIMNFDDEKIDNLLNQIRLKLSYGWYENEIDFEK